MERKTIEQYSFYGMFIPEYMVEGIYRFINKGTEPGGFLSSVISNDLFAAVGRADSANINLLPLYCAFFYNEAPSNCYGSKAQFNAWLKVGGLEGIRMRQEAKLKAGKAQTEIR